MGKYMLRNSKSNGGVRTRAKTLALSKAAGSYIQLRSRRFVKPTSNTVRKNEKLGAVKSNKKCAAFDCKKLGESKIRLSEDIGNDGEGSFGENVLEIESKERSTQETTPCNLIGDPDTISTPGSSTKRTYSSNFNHRVQNSAPSLIPLAIEMDDLFTEPEKQQQRLFVENTMPPRRQTYSDTEIAQLIAQGVAEAMAAQHQHSGSDTFGNGPQPKPCSYKDFLRCKPLNFKGTEGAIGLLRWIGKMESVFWICNCQEGCKVKYSTYTFIDGALTWWNTYAQTVGIDNAYQTPWEELKKMLKDEYCPRYEMHQLENEFSHLTTQGNDIAGYTTRFHQLALLCPSMVDPEYKRIERYIRGLPPRIRGMVTASNSTTIQSAVRMAHNLMAQVTRRGAPATKDNSNQPGDNKRKWPWNNNDKNHISQPSKRSGTVKAYSFSSEPKKGYTGNKPFCWKCHRHHNGPCGNPCTNCHRYGHLARECRSTTTNTNINQPRACFECGNTGHFRNQCPKLKNKGNNTTKGSLQQ